MTELTLTDAARDVLASRDTGAKRAKTAKYADAWFAGAIGAVGATPPPDRPARPSRPELLPPRDMPKRRAGGSDNHRAALLHAVAHIELNAIDLAWDLVGRFPDSGLPKAFYDDWVGVARDEARHFELVTKRLSDLGIHYGDLPAHDGLWEMAEATRGNLAARLAIVPMVLEARGLDVTPAMIARFEKIGDTASARVLNVIYQEEIGHVAAGQRWFRFVCDRQGAEPEATWRDLVTEYFHGLIKPPFNTEARNRAGLSEDFYGPLAATA